MRALDRVRKEGQAVLVFPSGTRYRPGKPETKKGVREIDSYIRLSDVMMLVSINGNCLRFSDVITSYSIHYTKLYDLSRPGARFRAERVALVYRTGGHDHLVVEKHVVERNNFV